MKIQVKSDLHIEGCQSSAGSLLSIHPDAEILVLAGDITNANSLCLPSYRLKKATIPVVYVPGNHEYYGGTTDILTRYREVYKDGPVKFLDNQAFVHNDVAFFCSTLWSNLASPNCLGGANFMGDFKFVRGMSIAHYSYLHASSVEWLRAELQKEDYKDMKKVVVTHHSPSFKGISPRWKGHFLNDFFHSDLEDIIEAAKPSLWIHGHTHDRLDYKIGDTRVVCNPRGYEGTEEPYQGDIEYKNDLIVEV